MTTFLGEEVMLNGGPHHGRLMDLPRPLPKFVEVTVEPKIEVVTLDALLADPKAMLQSVPMPKRACYARTPVNYDTTRGRVTFWLYDYVPPPERSSAVNHGRE